MPVAIIVGAYIIALSINPELITQIYDIVFVFGILSLFYDISIKRKG